MERTATLGVIPDSADQVIAMITPTARMMAINRIGAEFFGPTPARLSGQNFFDLLPPEFGIRLADQIAEVIATGHSSEIDAANRGRIFHVTVIRCPATCRRGWWFTPTTTDKVAAETFELQL